LQISIDDRRLRKCASSEKELRREYGARQAEKIARRLTQIRAAETLSELGGLPGVHLEELRADRRGQFSVWLEQPYRLILEPAHDPVPQIEDGTIDRRQVTAVSIIEIVDYH
jgi:proteic killer suppression protein